MENVSGCNIMESVIKRIFDIHINMDKQETKEADNRYYKTADSMNKNHLSNEISHRLLKKKKKQKYKLANKIADSSEYKITDSSTIGSIQKEFNSETLNGVQEKKKQKYKLADEITNASECKITDSSAIALNQNDFNIETANGSSKKRKKKQKYKLFDETTNTSECKITNSSAIGSNQNDFDSETLKGVPEKKKKKHKYKLTDEIADAFECKITDSSVTALNQNDFNIEIPNRVSKNKKQKSKLANKTANASECKIIDSSAIESNLNDFMTLNGVPEKKKQKYKLTDEISNASKCIISDSSVIELSPNVFNSETLNGVPEKKRRKYKLADEIANASECKVTDSSTIALNQNDFNIETLNGFSKKKKRKNKLIDEIANAKECKITDSSAIRLNQNCFNTETPNGVSKKKKKKHRGDKMESISDSNIQQSAKDESEKLDIVELKRFHEHEQTKASYISDHKTDDLNVIKLSENDLNNEDLLRFQKHKCNTNDKTENTSDQKNSDSTVIAMTQTTVNAKVQDGSYKKKKKKHKLFVAKGNLFESEVLELATDELEKSKNVSVLDDLKIIDGCNDLNSNPLDSSHQNKKKKHKLLVEKGNLSFCDIQKLATNELEKGILFDASDTLKTINEYKQTENYLTIDSDNIEMNYNNLISETFGGLQKTKGKKHKLPDLENNSVIESNKTENKNILHDHMKEKSILQNKVDDRLIINKESKKLFQKEIEVILDNLHKKEKNITSQSPEKEKNVNSQSPAKEKNVSHKSSKKEKSANAKEKNVSHKSSKKEKSANAKERNVTCQSTKKEKNATCKSPEKDKSYQKDVGVYKEFDPFVINMDDMPVPFTVPALHAGETAASLLPNEKTLLEENGVAIRNGKWTKTEDDILTRNFLKFGLDFGVNNPFQLLGINQDRKNTELAKFLKAKHFLVRLGKDLNDRTLRSIYMRARKLLNPLKCKRKLSVNETTDLKHAHELVGNKWTRISDMLSRSESNCHTAYRWHNCDINKGRWTQEEERNLVEAIKTVSGADDISANNVKDISWKEVAKYVPTRNEFQCHKQWAYHLAWDSSVSEKKKWQKCHYGKLIYLIKDKYCFCSESEIDFKELHKHFIDVAPSYMFLRKKWLLLKGNVAKELKLSFGTCLNALKKMYEKQFQVFANEETLTC